MRILSLGLVATLVLVLPAVARAADWPQYGGPDRNAVSRETAWKADWSGGPKVLWKAEVGAGYASVAVLRGRVYTMGAGGGGEEGGRRGGRGGRGGPSAVVCLDADTGAELWRTPLGGGENAATPAVDDRAVYAVAPDGTVGCLALADGAIKWQTNLVRDHGVQRGGWQIACSPLLEGSAIILDAGKTIALEKSTGKVLWSAGGAKAGYASTIPFKIGAKAYLTSFNGAGLAIVDAASHQVVATQPWQTAHDVNSALPMIAGDKIFICSGYGRGAGLVQFDGSGARLLYDKKVLRAHCNGPVLIGGYLYGLDGQMGSSGALQCVEMATGEVKWAAPVKIGAMSAAGDRLIVQADGGEVLIAQASPAGYKCLARAQVLDGKCWTMPILANARIHARSHSGRVVCLDVAAGR